MFRDFWFALPVSERVAFAARGHSSRGFLNQVAYGHKRIELGLADVIVALAGGLVALDDLPLTENAMRQRHIREKPAPIDPALLRLAA